MEIDVCPNCGFSRKTLAEYLEQEPIDDDYLLARAVISECLACQAHFQIGGMLTGNLAKRRIFQDNEIFGDPFDPHAWDVNGSWLKELNKEMKLSLLPNHYDALAARREIPGLGTL